MKLSEPVPRRTVLALVAWLAGLTACATLASSEPVGVAHGTYYTRFGMRLERDLVRSTNYRTEARSLLVPINTEVELVGTRRNRFEMRLASGRTFTFEHVARHTKDTPSEAFAAFFAPEPLDLSAFTSEERSAIEAGRVEPGMSRDAVLAAIGPPPASGTLDLAGPAWKYWSMRWSTFMVRFGDDGEVVSVGR